MTSLNERLQTFLAHQSIKMSQFERICGLSQGLGAKLSSKSNAITFKRISDNFPFLNIEWLKTGEGEMLKAPVTSGDTIEQRGNRNIGKATGPIDLREGTFYEPCPDDKVEIERLTKELAHLNEKLGHKDETITTLKERIKELSSTISHHVKTIDFLMAQLQTKHDE